jgi:hypothetical protein
MRGTRSGAQGVGTMTIDKESLLLLRLQRSSPSESVDLANMFLTSTDVQPVSERVLRVRVSEAAALWRTRLQNVRFTNKPIRGVEWLVKRLDALAPEEELEQFNFRSREFAGSLFFTVSENEFVGVVFVDRRPDDPSIKV